MNPLLPSSGTQFQQFSDEHYSGVLTAAGGAQTLTVPGGSSPGKSTSGSNNLVLAVISVSDAGDIYVANNETAVIPVGAIQKQAGELVHAYGGIERLVNIGDVLSFITAATSTEVSISFYQAL